MEVFYSVQFLFIDLHSRAEPSSEWSDSSKSSWEASFTAESTDERSNADQQALAILLNCQRSTGVSVASSNISAISSRSRCANLNEEFIFKVKSSISFWSHYTCAVLDDCREADAASCVWNHVQWNESQELRRRRAIKESSPSWCNRQSSIKVIVQVSGFRQVHDLNEGVDGDSSWKADNGNVVSKVVWSVVLVPGQPREWNCATLLVWLFPTHDVSSMDSFDSRHNVNLKYRNLTESGWFQTSQNLTQWAAVTTLVGDTSDPPQSPTFSLSRIKSRSPTW